MSLFPSKNYRHNQRIPLPDAPINGQSLGAVSGMKFGLSTVSYSGCEVIAVYNALLLSESAVPFCEVARYMERYRVLLGFWGTNFFSLGRCLERFGLRARRVRRPEQMQQALADGSLCLYVFWVGKRFRSQVHTVCMRQSAAGRVHVWNAYNHCGHVIDVPQERYLSHGMIFGYVIAADPEPDAAQPRT